MFNPFRPKTVRQPQYEELPPEQPAPEAAPELLLTAMPAPPPPVPAPAPAPPPPMPAPMSAFAPVLTPAPAVAPAPASAAGPAPLSTTAASALEQLVARLPGLLFAGLTEVESGTAVRARTPGDLLAAGPLARYHAELIRLKRLALRQVAQGATPEVLREVLVTMSGQLHLLRLVRDGELLLSIVLDPRQISLPTARMALQTAANLIG